MNYRDKYLELLMNYHKLHSVLSDLTINLTNNIAKMDLPKKQNTALLIPVYNNAARIIEIDKRVNEIAGEKLQFG